MMKTLHCQFSKSGFRAPIQTQKSQEQNKPMSLEQINSTSFEILKKFLRTLYLQLLDGSWVPPAQTTLSLDLEWSSLKPA